MFGLILLSLLASAAASDVYVDGPCPDVHPIDNFNFKSFGTGKWYEVGRYPNSKEGESKCGWTEYGLNGDVFSIKSYYVLTRKLHRIEGSGQLADDAGKSGKLIYTLPYGVDGASTRSIAWVLGTDYDNYAVVYFCKFDEAKNSRQDFTWVLSRSKKLEGDAKTAADKILKDSTYIDSSKLVWPDFSDEACKYDV